jgi:hypothetical protein
MWIVYSLKNRKSWYAPIDKFIQISSLLSVKAKYCLSDIDFIKGSINDWFVLNDEYAMHLADLIDSLMKEETLDEDLALELERLKEVLEEGSVVMG